MTVAVRCAKSGLNHLAMAATALVTRSCVDSDDCGAAVAMVSTSHSSHLKFSFICLSDMDFLFIR